MARHPAGLRADPGKHSPRRWRTASRRRSSRRPRRTARGSTRRPSGRSASPTLGIASVVGAGIFVTTGDGRRAVRRPGASSSRSSSPASPPALTAICYAELAAMIPIAGSHLLLRLRGLRRRSWPGSSAGTCCSSTCSRRRPSRSAGRATSSASSTRSAIHVPHDLANPPFGDDAGIVNLPAIVIVVGRPRLLDRRDARVGRGRTTRSWRSRSASCCSSSSSARATSTPRNWSPFIPAERGRLRRLRRHRGSCAAPGSCSSPTSASTPSRRRRREARNPQRTVPIGLLATVLISTVLYVAIGLVLTGIVPYEKLNVADPLSKAVQARGVGADWLDDGARRRRPWSASSRPCS